MKTVVYLATRNIYRNLFVCMESVLKNGCIDEVVFLIEDDEFPYPLADNVLVINVAKQKYISKRTENAKRYWTWMCMMKCTMTKYFPDKDRVLILDCDTIVEKDISGLWNLDLTGYYYAAVKQKTDGRQGEFTKGDYFNTGVLLCNLEKLRDGMEDHLIYRLNTNDYKFPEQDCINRYCEGNILPLAGRYNSCFCCVEDKDIYIRHYAADPEWVERYGYGKS